MFDKVKEECEQNTQDESGKIDASEIKDVLTTEIGSGKDAIWKQMVKDADVNGDGQIDFDEFLKMMYSSQKDSGST